MAMAKPSVRNNDANQRVEPNRGRDSPRGSSIRLMTKVEPRPQGVNRHEFSVPSLALSPAMCPIDVMADIGSHSTVKRGGDEVKMRRIVLLSLLLCLPAEAREVTVGVGLSLSPYVIPEELRGMEYDIAKSALALEGHEMKPVFLPLGRVAKALDGGQMDAAMTQRPGTLTGLVYSDIYIVYRNYAITLASRQLNVDRLEDLSGKSVLAFQRATSYLGPEFKKVAEANQAYREEANQLIQPLLLYKGRVDVVVADRNIFDWFANQPEVRDKADISQPVTYHPLFPPTEYRVAFRDVALRDAFNRGLARLRAEGEYDRIIARYSKAQAPALSISGPSGGSR
ncbi:ABC-type amino acid transport/signal transduction systems [Paramagnetospirillum magneticum AMB-1]|uniref:ABC-type amino acid transport/signal transduction systems n=2 Tax=Paramagnetospirillum magneticum TaxID=84159 RepID=Q2WAY5_PARM1|nr:ABC-type amino acid transport/signal transduction systems [Paramagnetospirillum magneticum AMB-1]